MKPLRTIWSALFRRREGTPLPAADGLRNWDAEAIRTEFKRRYLTEFTRYTAEDMVANHNGAVNFLAAALILGGSTVFGPAAPLIGSVIALRHMLARKDMAAAIHIAGKQLKHEIATGGKAQLDGVEAWLDGHEAELPDYLDKLDRAEDEQRALRRLIQRLNKAGSLAGLTKDERNLFRRHGYGRLRLPIQPILRLPPRIELDNRHHAQLSRALWRDVTATAGDRARPFKRLLGLARIPAAAKRR
jgi:hypothetical protein